MGYKYRYTIKSYSGTIIAVMDDITNVLIFLEALNDKYYCEPKLAYTVERTTINGEE